MINIKKAVRNHFEKYGVEIAGALLAMNGNTSGAIALVENR